MATAKKQAYGPASRWLRVLLVAALLTGGVVWYFHAEIGGYTQTGTAYGARTACSCRHLGGRSLASCEEDFMPGMEFVFLSEDEAAQSVTAYVPLIASTTATFREGFGCVLEPWKN